MSKWERVEFDQIKVGDRIKAVLPSGDEAVGEVIAAFDDRSAGTVVVNTGSATVVCSAERTFYRREVEPPKLLPAEPQLVGTVVRIDYDDSSTTVAYRFAEFIGFTSVCWRIIDSPNTATWGYLARLGTHPRVTVLYTPDREAGE